jgi:hypothetical protein
MQQHYCEKHQTKFYRNERTDATGQLKVWYSHKMLDGAGFCVEQNDKATAHEITPRSKGSLKADTNSYNTIFACNAMNNAIALANSGKIELNQIESYFKKILTGLEKAQA